MKWGHGELDVFVGDVWELATQAIVSPINAELIPAAGLGNEVMRMAGLEAIRELRAFDKVEIGGCVTTSSGNLKTQRIIHVAISTLSSVPALPALEDGLENILAICREDNIASIAIPMFASGPGALPMNTVANVILRESLESLRASRWPTRIVMAVPNDDVERTVLNAMKKAAIS